MEAVEISRCGYVDGAHNDGVGYGVLREEWQAHYPESFPASL